jgi:GNAT superfamily N-acetyltransferase/effector-binding domain-containing protein
LLRLLDAYLNAQYGALQAEYDQHNVMGDGDTVVLAYDDRRPAGCGALRPYDHETVEIKRMYVRPAYRGQGIGSQVLGELENWAIELGYTRAILETALKQLEAIGLYRKHGYRQIENYGPYVAQPNSVCFEKTLPSREDSMNPCTIAIKSVPQIRAVAVRVSSDQAYEPLFEQARERVTAFAADHNLQATGLLMGVYYEDPTDPDCACDFAVAFPTESPVEADQPIQVLVLPAVDTMATCTLPGDVTADEADEVYEYVIAWIKANHYQIDGPYREIFHPSCEGQNVPEPVIEIQFPIKKTN